MKIELSQTRFDEGIGVFDVGCVLVNSAGVEIKIVKFSGFSVIDETDGNTEHETINVHFCDDSEMDFEDLTHAVIRDRSYEPVSPDWFIEEVKLITGARVRRTRRHPKPNARRKRRQNAQQCAFTPRSRHGSRRRDLSSI